MHTPEPISGNILIIDKDERLPREKAALEEAGFTVITATTAADGLALARDRHPDLVISDVMLEKPDAGFVLGHRMKHDPALSRIPLVLLSSVSRELGVVFDLNSPEGRQWIKADLYLDRPIPLERLVGKVRGLLQHRQSA